MVVEASALLAGLCLCCMLMHWYVAAHVSELQYCALLSDHYLSTQLCMK